MAKNFVEKTASIIEMWADSVTFADDLARVFFAATIVTALEQAYKAGIRAEAKKRKASISARYQKRLTKRVPDVAKSGKNNRSISGKRPARSPRR